MGTLGGGSASPALGESVKLVPGRQQRAEWWVSSARTPSRLLASERSAAKRGLRRGDSATCHPGLGSAGGLPVKCGEGSAEEPQGAVLVKDSPEQRVCVPILHSGKQCVASICITSAGTLQRHLYKGQHAIFKYPLIFEGHFIQISKREVIDVHRVRVVTLRLTSTSPATPETGVFIGEELCPLPPGLLGLFPFLHPSC